MNKTAILFKCYYKNKQAIREFEKIRNSCDMNLVDIFFSYDNSRGDIQKIRVPDGVIVHVFDTWHDTTNERPLRPRISSDDWSKKGCSVIEHRSLVDVGLLEGWAASRGQGREFGEKVEVFASGLDLLG